MLKLIINYFKNRYTRGFSDGYKKGLERRDELVHLNEQDFTQTYPFKQVGTFEKHDRQKV